MALCDAGGASFDFDIRDVDKQELCGILPSLLVQLSVRSDACCDKLAHLCSMIVGYGNLGIAQWRKALIKCSLSRGKAYLRHSGRTRQVSRYVRHTTTARISPRAGRGSC